jgi:hypothetical protein
MTHLGPTSALGVLSLTANDHTSIDGILGATDNTLRPTRSEHAKQVTRYDAEMFSDLEILAEMSFFVQLMDTTAAHNRGVVVLPALARDMAQRLCSVAKTFGRDSREEDREAICQRLDSNTAADFCLAQDASANSLLEICTGDYIRWETIGVVAAVAAWCASLELQTSPSAVPHGLRGKSLANMFERLHLASRRCVRICDTNHVNGVLVTWHLYQDLLVSRCFHGDECESHISFQVSISSDMMERLWCGVA